MKHLLNTLYITNEKSYLSLNGENIVISEEDQEIGRFPLHTLNSIIYFGYKGATPALIGKCAKYKINLAFFTPNGKFLARVVGNTSGNIFLRKEQYRISDDESRSCNVARNIIAAKVHNSRWILERAARDHPYRVDVDSLKHTSNKLAMSIPDVMKCENLNDLRGFEGIAANLYFNVLDDLILQNKNEFYMIRRSRRPPLDKTNALLSFVYTLLLQDYVSALEGVGLDPYAGFLHRDRAGRASLALDLMEELRSVYADRFVISLINNRTIKPDDLIVKENGAVILTNDGRKILFKSWQLKKKEGLTHPFLQEKITWGLVPHTQSLLLSRYVRGDLDAYPPFFWK